MPLQIDSFLLILRLLLIVLLYLFLMQVVLAITRGLGKPVGPKTPAVLGSLVASHFRSSIHDAVSGLPAKATHSLAEALQHAAALGGVRGGTIAHAARDSFVTAFDSTLWIAMSRRAIPPRTSRRAARSKTSERTSR